MGTRSIHAFDVPALPNESEEPALAFIAGTPDIPSDLYIRDDQNEEHRLTNINESYLSNKDVRTPEELNFTAPDGQQVQGWLVRPPANDHASKPPLAVNIHGGPHTMWGPSFRTMWHEWQVLAHHGYAVFFCNPRGSEGYGKNFQTAIFNNWGYSDSPDILAGIDAVLASGEFDSTRICVTGGSYGGYMTAWLVSHDHRFSAAVAQRGVYNLTSLYGTSDAYELIEDGFEGRPAENLDRLARHSPLTYAHQIQTPLLLLHSEQDYRAPIADAEQMFSILRRLGREVEFVRYPREGHELSRSGELKHRIDRLQRIVDWFDQYSQTAPNPPVNPKESAT